MRRCGTIGRGDAFVELEKVTHTYGRGERQVHALAETSLRIEKGDFVALASVAGLRAFPGEAVYNASKFGLNGFSEALMQEVRHDGIKVSYVMPGSVNTEFGGHGLGRTMHEDPHVPNRGKRFDCRRR